MKRVNKKNNIKIIAICVALLAFAAMIQLNTGKANAKTVPEHLYALSVSTGVADGSSVGFFSVEYKDTKGNTHTERIFPHDGDYFASCQMVAEYGTDDKIAQNVNAMGYSYPTANYNDSKNAKALDINSENVYFLELGHEVASVESITIYTDYSSTVSKNWSCTGIRFYEVTAIGGYRYFSNSTEDAYVDFAGTLMARMKLDRHEFNSAHDTAFVLSEDSSRYPLITSNFEEPDRTLADESYIFKLDLADVYGAGIESFVNTSQETTLKNMMLPEMINLTVSYRDIFNGTRTIEVPVVINALSYAFEQLGDNVTVAHFAGQGDSIAFPVKLPHLAKVTGVKVSYGTNGIKEVTGLQDLENVPERNEIINNVKAANDTIGLEALTIYEESAAGLSLAIENNTVLVPTLAQGAKPLYYYLSPKADGLSIAVDKSASLDMKAYEEGAKLSHTNTAQKYLIVIDTEQQSTTASRSNVPDIQMQLTYTATDGSTRTTEAYELESLAKQYYGFVPNTDGENCGYAMQVRAGGQLKVIITLEEVEKFTGASFSLSDTRDEWQMSNLQIFMMTKESDRKANWLGGSLSFFGQAATVEYYRDIDGSSELNVANQLLEAKQDVFLHNGESKTLEFDSMSITEAIKREDWTKDNYYSMDYNMATSDLGFYATDMHYQVAVKVADNSSADVDDGDSGSKNFFYFQLLFENGKESAVVQANQQLEADGFLTGRVATFNIASNRDYGELEAIRIIPDDISEDADPYDKLNIENITVTKRSGSGYSTVWTIDNVGWIGPEYKDDGEKGAAKENENGRTMEELSQTFAVTGSESSVQFQFAITTGNYGKMDATLQRQFVGTMSAEISYIDTNGVYQTTNGIDVVEYMYYYAEKTPGAKSSSGLRVSDSSYMFLENGTNRFTVNINNVKKIVDMRLFVTSDSASVLNLASVSCSLVQDDGHLAINKWGEYERTSEIVEITSNADVIPPIEIGGEGTMECVIDFIDTDENMIDGLIEGTWPFKIPADSIAKYDYINAFVYPTEPADAPKDVKLQLAITYADAYGKSYMVTRSVTPQAGEDGYYYSTLKLGTARLNAIKEVKVLKAGGSVDEKIDHVIIQRVRGGSILQTERYEFNGKSASAEPSGIYAGMLQEAQDRQVVSLAFADNMSKVELERGTKDVAVALRYTSKNDPSGAEYISPYVYLTDKNFKELAGGNSAQLNFNIAYLDEVRGIEVAATGGLTVEVGNAYVATYMGTDLEEELTGWYSILANTKISNKSVSFDVSTSEIKARTTVVPVRLLLTTGTELGQNAGTDGAVAMTMSYVGFDGYTYTEQIADLTPYIVSGGFNSGETAEVLILQENVKEITSFTFEPRNVDVTSSLSKKSWKLDEMAVSYGVDSKEYVKTANVSVGTYIYEGEPRTVSVKNIILEVSYLENGTYVTVDRTSLSGVIRDRGEEVVFQYRLYNSVEGAQVKAYEMIGSAKRDITDSTITTRYNANGVLEYVFTVPNEEGDQKEREFLVEVRSLENVDMSSSFTVVTPENSN